MSPHSPRTWDAAAAASARPIIPWRGEVWRAHHKRAGGTDDSASRRYSARYHRAPDLFPNGLTWAALYYGLTYGVCIAEVVRHVTPASLATLKNRRLSRLVVELSAVLDCRDLAALGVSEAVLLHDLDYSAGQDLAAAAIARGCEALLIPSATRLPDDVLVIFPDSLRATSRLEVVETVDPVLYVERPS